VIGDGMSGRARGVTKETCSGGSGAGVRVPIVAGKRLITVEPRGAGKWKRERQTKANTTAGSAAS
jgi:hypothetical protein